MHNIKSLDTIIKEGYEPLIGTSMKVFMISPVAPDSYAPYFVRKARKSDVEKITELEVMITGYYLDMRAYECFMVFQFTHERTTEEVTLR